jgi:hypothetical protein
MNKNMIDKWRERKMIMEAIHTYKERKEQIDKEFIELFTSQYEKCHTLQVRTHFKIMEIHNADHQYHQWKGKLDPNLFHLAIVFIDSCKDDDYDHAIIPVIHFDSGLTKHDLTTHNNFFDERQKKIKENAEREEYARLKAKFK